MASTRTSRRGAKRPQPRAAKVGRRQPAAKSRMSTRRSVTSSPAPKSKPLEPGGMTVREAGRKGGLIGGKKGGETVKRERGVKFYREIGRIGGQRVRDLIAAGRRELERPARRRHT